MVAERHGSEILGQVRPHHGTQQVRGIGRGQPAAVAGPGHELVELVEERERIALTRLHDRGQRSGLGVDAVARERPLPPRL